jgi:hypothetical protein
MSIVLNEIYEEDGAIVFCEARKLGREAIVSKRGRRRIGKRSPVAGAEESHFSTSQKFWCLLGAHAATAGLLAVRYIARLFVEFFLLLAGLTGLVIRLLLLPLLLLPAALLLATLAALLFLLVPSIRHSFTPLNFERR